MCFIIFSGSKMVPVWSWLQMGKDLLLIRLRYILGAWKIRSVEHLKNDWYAMSIFVYKYYIKYLLYCYGDDINTFHFWSGFWWMSCGDERENLFFYLECVCVNVNEVLVQCWVCWQAGVSVSFFVQRLLI